MRFQHGMSRIGQTVHHVRRAIGQADKGMRIALAVHDEVKMRAATNKLSAAAEKCLIAYEVFPQRTKEPRYEQNEKHTPASVR